MTFEETIVSVKKIHSISTGKDSEIYITYKGTAGGVMTPWVIKIDTKEAKGKSDIEAALSLYLLIKEELLAKIATMENQISSYRQALNANTE